MNILGFEIIRKKDRDDNPFGRVMYNIQIHEKGLTLSNPDGTGVPMVGIEVDPRAWLLGHVEAEKFSRDWDTIFKMPDADVMEWAMRKNEYIAAGVSSPTTKALEDITSTKKNDGGEMYR
jgi:hypothetical protein